MNIRFFICSLLLVALIGCSGQKETKEPNYLDPIDVVVTTTADLQEDIKTQITVTQKDEPVIEASEVILEIWQHGNPDSYLKEEAKNLGNGVYEVTWQANEAGIYYFYYHVTANGMHKMEKQQFVIGEDVDVEKILETPDERPRKHMH